MATNLSFPDRVATREGEPHRLRKRRAERHAPAREVGLEVVDGDRRADLEFEQGRPALLIDAEIEREAVAEANQALKPRGGVEDSGDGAPRALVLFATQIDHAGDEGRLAPLAESAARSRRISCARQRLVVLHGEEGAAGLARRILRDALDAELVGERTAEVHEACAHVVALDERLNKRAVAIALPDAPRALSRLGYILAKAVGEN